MYKAPIGKTFELYDIGEQIKPGELRRAVSDNIEFLLEREKLLPRGYSVVIPVGGDHWETEDDGRYTYTGSFEVFAPDLDTIVAYGWVRADGIWTEVDKGYLDEIEVSITELTGNPEKPKRKSGKKRLPRVRRNSATLRGLRR